MDEEIILEIRRSYPDVIKAGGLGRREGDNVFSSLGGRLGKAARRIRQHWHKQIEHVLTRYQHGKLDEDFKAKLLHYMVDNSLKNWQDVKWDEVARLPEFLGSTGPHLKLQAETLSDGAQKNLKKRSIVTVEEMQKWYTSSDKKEKQSKVRERENHYINVWLG